jgi:hypothetical protein
MALKAVYDKQTDIPEAQHDLYVERDGRWWLDAEGVEDVSGLKAALNGLKAERTQLLAEAEKFAEKFKDIDPEKYRALLKKVTEEEEDALKRQGKHEEVFAERLKKVQDEHAQVLTAKDAEVAKLKSALATERIANTMKSAAITAGVREDALDLLVIDGSRFWRLDDDGQARAYEKDDQRMYGKDGDPISMQEFVAAQVKLRPFLLKASTGSGANDQGGGRGGSGAVHTITREQARNIRTYEAAKEAAQKAGASLVIDG